MSKRLQGGWWLGCALVTASIAGCNTVVRVDARSGDDGDDGPVVCMEGDGSCTPDEFCLFETGTCEVEARQGVCVQRPDACPEVFAPVCGCDGETYANACEANAAGVSIDREGEC